VATYRQIHISFWQDGFVLGLTPEEKYFYLYLMSNSKTTQCGIYELPKRVIEMETGYNRETVDKLIERFMQYRKIDYYEQTQEIIIYNWIKHNSLKSPKVKACIAKELKTVKYQAFILLFKHLCIRYGYPIDSLFIDLGEEEEKEEEKEEEEKAPPTVSNGHQDRITKWFNEYEIKGGIDGLHDVISYTGQADLEVIEKAMRKSRGKHVNYFCRVMNEWIAEGKTKVSDFQVVDFKSESQQRTQPKEFIPDEDDEVYRMIKVVNGDV
jgi:hypothetical protein